MLSTTQLPDTEPEVAPQALFDEVYQLAKAQNEAGLEALINAGKCLEIRIFYPNLHLIHTPCSLLAFQGDYGAANLLVKVGNLGLLNSYVFGAALSGDKYTVDYLLSKGASINVAVKGYALRHIFETNASVQSEEKAEKKSEQDGALGFDTLVEDLLNCGASVNSAAAAYGQAALYQRANDLLARGAVPRSIMVGVALRGDIGQLKLLAEAEDKVMMFSANQIIAQQLALAGKTTELKQHCNSLAPKEQWIINKHIVAGFAEAGRRYDEVATYRGYMDNQNAAIEGHSRAGLAPKVDTLLVGPHPIPFLDNPIERRNAAIKGFAQNGAYAKVASLDHPDVAAALSMVTGYALGQHTVLLLDILKSFAISDQSILTEACIEAIKKCAEMGEFGAIEKILLSYHEEKDGQWIIAKPLVINAFIHSVYEGSFFKEESVLRTLFFLKSDNVYTAFISLLMNEKNYAISAQKGMYIFSKFNIENMRNRLEVMRHYRVKNKFSFNQALAWTAPDVRGFILYESLFKSDEHNPLPSSLYCIIMQYLSALSYSDAQALYTAQNQLGVSDVEVLNKKIVEIEKTQQCVYNKNENTPLTPILNEMKSSRDAVASSLKDSKKVKEVPPEIMTTFKAALGKFNDINLEDLRAVEFCKLIVGMLQNYRYWNKTLSWPKFGAVQFQTPHGAIKLPANISALNACVSQYPEWETKPETGQQLLKQLKRVADSYSDTQSAFNKYLRGLPEKNYISDAHFSNPDLLAVKNHIAKQNLQVKDMHGKLCELTGRYLKKLTSSAPEFGLVTSLADSLKLADPSNNLSYYQSINKFDALLKDAKANQQPHTLTLKIFLQKLLDVLSILTVIPGLIRAGMSRYNYNTYCFWRSENQRMQTCADDQIKELRFQEPGLHVGP